MVLSGSFLMCSRLSVPVPMPCPVFREPLCLDHLLAFDYIRIRFFSEETKEDEVRGWGKEDLMGHGGHEGDRGAFRISASRRQIVEKHLDH